MAKLPTKCNSNNGKKTRGRPRLSRQCEKCGKIFTRPSGLRTHTTNDSCNPNDKVKIKELENAIMQANHERDMYMAELKGYKDAVKSGKAGNTYNLSVKNYCIKYFNEAPALESLPMEKLETIGQNQEGLSLIDKLVRETRHGTLVIYLGGFIRQHYEKKNKIEWPKQSVWTTDTARQNYIVRTTVKDDDDQWLTDKGGSATKDRIINPILGYIKTRIEEYMSGAYIEEQQCMVTDQIMRQAKKGQILTEIVESIKDEKLHYMVLKYIGPYFQLNPGDYTDIIEALEDHSNSKNSSGFVFIDTDDDSDLSDEEIVQIIERAIGDAN